LLGRQLRAWISSLVTKLGAAFCENAHISSIIFRRTCRFGHAFHDILDLVWEGPAKKWHFARELTNTPTGFKSLNRMSSVPAYNDARVYRLCVFSSTSLSWIVFFRPFLGCLDDSKLLARAHLTSGLRWFIFGHDSTVPQTSSASRLITNAGRRWVAVSNEVKVTRYFI